MEITYINQKEFTCAQTKNLFWGKLNDKSLYFPFRRCETTEEVPLQKSSDQRVKSHMCPSTGRRYPHQLPTRCLESRSAAWVDSGGNIINSGVQFGGNIINSGVQFGGNTINSGVGADHASFLPLDVSSLQRVLPRLV